MARTGEQAGDFVLLGKITKAHGIRGELKLFPFTERPENFLDYSLLYFSAPDCFQPEKQRVRKARVQGKQVILYIDGCSDRNTAESLVGTDVFVERSALPELDDGEFYLLELLGKTAVSDGQEIGTIAHVVTGSGQDLLQVVSRDGKEILIPLVADFVVQIEQDTVVFDLPPGLLELNS